MYSKESFSGAILLWSVPHREHSLDSMLVAEIVVVTGDIFRSAVRHPFAHDFDAEGAHKRHVDLVRFDQGLGRAVLAEHR
jgi:hypothetical protein